MANFDPSYLTGVFAAVAFGSVVPILPTGAVVSVAAVLAVSDHIYLLAVVLAVGAAGAYLGDLATYAALRWAGEGLTRRVRWLRAGTQRATLARFQRELEEHELRTLLVSRLVPAGRIPVLVAAALGGYSLRRYVLADLVAVTLWAAVYAAIGLAGNSIFPQAWQGVVAAIVLVVAVSVAPPLVGRWRRRRAHPSPPESESDLVPPR